MAVSPPISALYAPSTGIPGFPSGEACRILTAAEIRSFAAAAQITGSTGSLVLPTGTTAQRDGSPAVGYSRWNTTTSRFERWTGSQWENYVRLSGDTLTGNLSVGSNSFTCGSLLPQSITGPGGSGLVVNDAMGIFWRYNGTNRVAIGSQGVAVYSAIYGNTDNAHDLGLTTSKFRTLYVGTIEASGTYTQKNGTTAQKAQWYNTYTDATTNEYLEISAGSTLAGTFGLTSRVGSVGGSNRPIRIGSLAADGTTFSGLTIATTGAGTFTGSVITPAATTSIPSIRIPHGTAPTSPTNGDVWTTTGGVFARLNGTTHKIGGETRTIGVVFDGAGSTITAGTKAYVSVPFDCVITAWKIFSLVSGSCVVDVWKDTYANYPPTVADTIAASAKPTLSSADHNQDTTLTGWTTSVSAGDVIGFNVDSATTVTRVIVQLSVRLT